MKQRFFFVLLNSFPLVVWMVFASPQSALGGVIKTVITCRYTVKSAGDLDAAVHIQNKGDAGAYNTTATLFLAGREKSFKGLGANPPGGDIHFKARFSNLKIMPGVYTAVIRVDFEEQNGKGHLAYHVSIVPYHLKGIRSLTPPLSLHLEPAHINKRAFWDGKGSIRLIMKNETEKLVCPHLSIYLPEGFSTDQPGTAHRLSPRGEKIATIPFTLATPVKRDGGYHLVVDYEWEGVHYSRHMKGKIQLVERPVYFRGYLVLSAATLLALLGVLYYRRRKGAQEG